MRTTRKLRASACHSPTWPWRRRHWRRGHERPSLRSCEHREWPPASTYCNRLWGKPDGGVDMMRLSEAAAMLGVPFVGEDAEVLRIATDSRTIRPGDLFIALRGEKFDGGRFAGQALGQGAVGVVLDPAQAPDVTAAIRVDDTRLALGKLAAAWRGRFAVPVVAITGSIGKTSFMDMLAAILRAEAGTDDAVLRAGGGRGGGGGRPRGRRRRREARQY